MHVVSTVLVSVVLGPMGPQGVGAMGSKYILVEENYSFEEVGYRKPPTGEGVSPSHGGDFFRLWGTKLGFGVHNKV